jgi:hypothetical protein
MTEKFHHEGGRFYISDSCYHGENLVFDSQVAGEYRVMDYFDDVSNDWNGSEADSLTMYRNNNYLFRTKRREELGEDGQKIAKWKVQLFGTSEKQILEFLDNKHRVRERSLEKLPDCMREMFLHSINNMFCYNRIPSISDF